MKRLFTYGILMQPGTMRAYAPDAILLGPARVPNWQLEFRGFCNAEPVEGSEIHGVLWEVSDDPWIWQRLDQLEGAYNRVEVEAELPDDSRCDAAIYSMKNAWARSGGDHWESSLRLDYRRFGLDLQLLREAAMRAEADERARGISRVALQERLEDWTTSR